MSRECNGQLVIVSGPSGAGKSTVLAKLLEQCSLPLKMSVSATTRPPRPGEIPGKDYFFITDEQFRAHQESEDFLEHKEVFGQGHWYGTLRKQVDASLEEGKWVILEIDVQGALAVLEFDQYQPITLFIHPGSLEELERRLRARGTETEEAVSRRLETAGREMNFSHRYQYEIINGSVDVAVAEICQILNDKKENHPCSKS